MAVALCLVGPSLLPGSSPARLEDRCLVRIAVGPSLVAQTLERTPACPHRYLLALRILSVIGVADDLVCGFLGVARDC